MNIKDLEKVTDYNKELDRAIEFKSYILKNKGKLKLALNERGAFLSDLVVKIESQFQDNLINTLDDRISYIKEELNDLGVKI